MKKQEMFEYANQIAIELYALQEKLNHFHIYTENGLTVSRLMIEDACEETEEAFIVPESIIDACEDAEETCELSELIIDACEDAYKEISLLQHTCYLNCRR